MKFIRDFSQVIAAGAQADFLDEIVPANSQYVIKSFGNDLSNVAAWTFVHWRILRNGIPVYPMDDIYDQMGYAAQRQPVENIILRGGQRFQVRGIANVGTPAGTAVLVSIEYEQIDNP